MPKRSSNEPILRFPKGFLWGSATSSYQVEGGNTNNQWYKWEAEGGHIKDGSVCGRADDFYHLYEKDLDLAKELGHNTFRFSVEWSRIEPQQGQWDRKEVEHYRDILKAMRKRELEPLVTLHHFTNPIWMESKGGWTEKSSVELFRRYTSYLAEELGDLVHIWAPINEPTAYASNSYMLNKYPPCESDFSKYQSVLRHMLLAHAEAYHAIHEAVGKNRTKSAPKVGTVKDTEYFQAYDENSQKDRDEASFLHKVDNVPFMEALRTGKVNPPMGTGEFIDTVKGAWDFIGFNYYSRMLVSALEREVLETDEHLTRNDSLGTSDRGFEIYPQGIYQIIKWLQNYHKPIYITENGIATKDDNLRSTYIVLHLEQIYKAIKEGAEVRGYYYWSLMDDFEWDYGYSKKYGLAEVDYRSLTRTPRSSAFVYKDIITRNGIPREILEKYQKLAMSLRQTQRWQNTFQR